MQQLIELEEKIEVIYLQLMNLEKSGLKKSLDYQILVEEVRRLVKLEMLFFMHDDFSFKDLKKVLEKPDKGPTLPVHLGCYEHAYFFRLSSLIDSISGDDTILYAVALNYDIYQIILKCVEVMLDNDYYREIKGDLLRVKYDLIYLDYEMESDFLLENEKESISLKSRILKEDLPSSKYVDQAILVYESLENIRYLRVLSLEFGEDYYSLAVVFILNILARVAMCNGETLTYVMNDFNLLLEDEELNMEIRNLIMEMIELFKQIQHEFYFKR